MKKSFYISVMVLLLAACNPRQEQSEYSNQGFVPFRAPKHYVCEPIEGVQIDGDLSEWEGIAWTDNFLDIEGADKPEPRFKTRAKMAWDNKHLYIAAELEEPHVWATLKQRDTIIFYDNDFEVFIDPDGDTHHYYELEVNALETAWDLLLTMPYRDFGHVIDSWNILGLQVGVQVKGSLNDPGDTDQGWTVELALPFSVLQECSSRDGIPVQGDFWRINFSRVEWQVDIVDGKYVKKKNQETGKNLPEDNWVWSPQYHINMHMPEYWGYLVFSEEKDAYSSGWQLPQDEQIKWQLRNIYYMQTGFRQTNGRYASTLSELGVADLDELNNGLIFRQTLTGYQAAMPAESGYWIINENGLIKKISNLNE